MPRRRLLLLILLVLQGPAHAEPGDASKRGEGSCLMTIPAAGGEAKELIQVKDRRCGSPRWSPDGQWVAFDTVLYAGGRVDRKAADVRTVRADGTGARVVGLGGMPTWSPDGKNLAWHTYDRGGVVVADADGSHPERVADHWGNPFWLRDGRRLVTLKHPGFAVYDLHTGKLLTLARLGPRPTWGYSASPSGDRVAYRTTNGELFIAALDPPEYVEEPRLKGGWVECPSWSPDGEKLVVAWGPPGGKGLRLFTLTADGDDEPEPIAGQPGGASNLQPDWSPDGKMIVFRRQTPPAPKAGLTR